jgi:hypothetical protein
MRSSTAAKHSAVMPLRSRYSSTTTSTDVIVAHRSLPRHHNVAREVCDVRARAQQ